MSKEIARDHSVLKEDFERARANVMNRGKDAFIAYNVSGDCISPLTGEHLFTQSDAPMVRFLADVKNEIDYDASLSLEANIIYEGVFTGVTNVVDEKAIRKQYDYPLRNKYGLKYELGEPNCTGGLSYRGDVMNSAEITNKVYYWEHKELHRNVTGKEFPWPEEALAFFDAYHTPGNFMIHPWRDGLDIDKARKDAGIGDYFDLFLLGIYNYFLEQDGKEPINGCSLFNVIGRSDSLYLFMRYYLMPFIEKDKRHYSDTPRQFIDDIEDGSDLIMYIVPGWESFVSRHLLHDFVERGHYDHFAAPRELWKGHFENYTNTREYPHNEQQFKEYWTNATDMIRKRSARIYDVLHYEPHRYSAMHQIRY